MISQADIEQCVYGPNQALNVKKNNSNYLFHLAAFKVKKNAINYQKKMRCITGQDVLLYKKRKDVPYWVLIKDIPNVKTLHKVSNKILNNKACIQAPKSPSIKSNEKGFFVAYGVSQANHNQSILLNANTGLTNHYISDNYNAGSFLLGVSTDKIYKAFQNTTKVYLGIEAAYLHHGNFSGDLQPATNLASNIDLLRYHFKLNSAVVLFNVKTEKANLFKNIGGYIKGGIGGAYNHLSSYYEAIPPGSGSAPMLFPYTNSNNYDAAFSAGIGFNQVSKSNGKVEVGYRYLNSGRGQLGTTPVQTTNQTIKTGRIASHMVEAKFSI